jgi:hypothetical protein
MCVFVLLSHPVEDFKKNPFEPRSLSLIPIFRCDIYFCLYCFLRPAILGRHRQLRDSFGYHVFAHAVNFYVDSHIYLGPIVQHSE